MMLREYPLGGGMARLTLSSIECLGGFELCCIVGLGFEGLPGF